VLHGGLGLRINSFNAWRSMTFIDKIFGLIHFYFGFYFEVREVVG
jgi:hypothetical protein